MNTYNIYDMNTDELLCEVCATNVTKAEIKASEQLEIASDKLYALSK